MSIKVGINGFGRIGRMVMRCCMDHPNIEIVGINDLCPADYLAYMLKFDTMHGKFKGTVSAEGSNIVVIDQRVSGTGIQVASEIGGRTPLHATSQGKLLLSQLPDATVRYLMNGQGMDPFTPHTIVTLPDLLEELEHIRRKGCAIENGEYKIGLRSVSAPVFDREGQMRYTLTVVGLFRHVASGEFEEAVDMVCAAAGSLSRELGYHA